MGDVLRRYATLRPKLNYLGYIDESKSEVGAGRHICW